MSIVLVKYFIVFIMGGALLLIAQRMQEVEEELVQQKISFQQYEVVKQAALGLGLVLLLFGMLIFAL